MAKHLSNDEFLTSLTTLLTSTHASSHGSIFLIQKPMPSTDTPSTLIRASNGKSKPHRDPKSGKSPKVKLSTVVDAQDLPAFYAKYAEVCKKGMEGLRKRDKKKAKAKRKKKTAGAEGSEAKKVG